MPSFVPVQERNQQNHGHLLHPQDHSDPAKVFLVFPLSLRDSHFHKHNGIPWAQRRSVFLRGNSSSSASQLIEHRERVRGDRCVVQNIAPYTASIRGGLCSTSFP